MEIKDLFEVIGYESDDDTPKIEDVKKYFQDTYIGRAVAHDDKDIIKNVYGKRLGSLTTKLKGIFGFSKQDVEDKTVEEILDLGVEKHTTKISDLEKQLKETNTDEKVKAAIKRAEAAEKKAKETATVHENLKTEFDTFKKNSSDKLKNHFINHAKTNTVAGITLKDDISSLEKAGFQQLLDSKYNYDWEENDNGGVLVVTDKEGQRVTVENGSDFATYEQIVTREAKEAKILALNGVKKHNTQQHKAGDDKPQEGLTLGRNAVANAAAVE